MGAGQSTSNDEQQASSNSNSNLNDNEDQKNNNSAPVSIHDKKTGFSPHPDVINHLYKPAPKQRQEEEVLEAYSPTNQRRRLDEDEETIPTVFRWPHGGRKVFLTGTFNGWKERIPMIRSGTEFIAILNLPCGKFTYKFIVDNEWKIDPNQETQTDEEGIINNVKDVENSRLKEYANGSGSPAGTPSKGNQTPRRASFSWDEQYFDDTKKQPQQLPPQLKYTPLNAKSQVIDEIPHMSLPLVPSLKHTYFSEKENVTKIGVSQRYKYKFATVVLYKAENVEGEQEPSSEESSSQKDDDSSLSKEDNIPGGPKQEKLDLQDFDVFGSPSMEISYDDANEEGGEDDLVEDFAHTHI
eukprot:gb/GECH01010177.1/.p1 GENE.gb/GECH01010177.1/~~gb/GECH01010177.1/.p1  ORF type:complete len:354 (+),score=108.82 gb/GECH01010177.1/:1-1062(+)